MNLQNPNSVSPRDPEEELCWLALRLVPGLGPRNARKLINTMGSVKEVFQASISELESIGIAPHVVKAMAAGTVFEAASLEAERARQLGITIVTIRDVAYSPLLREIFDPPLVLYAKGDLGLLQSPSIAIVGTRRTTAYGRAITTRISEDLACRGITIVSGMARGVDSIAHRGALDKGGKTIAVLGTGLDVIYPSENKKLFEQIAVQGLVISEFPLGSFPAPQNFPIRNRIISGISLGVIVVEAAEHSGALITARLAMDQNREVFAVPGALTNRYSWGPNLLIKQGAKLIQDWQDVAEELPSEVRQRLLAVSDATHPNPAASLFAEGLTEQEKGIFNLLKIDEAVHIDVILDSLPDISSSAALSSLLELEFKNLIRQLPGKNFVRTF